MAGEEKSDRLKPVQLLNSVTDDESGPAR